jgi:hypothetical protein
MEQSTGAALFVQCLKEKGVRQILGIPGAKIDRVYDQLLDDGPPLIVCRHEQNAAFIAGAIGRMTGRPGVVLVTSGRGTSDLATGLVTATTETGYPGRVSFSRLCSGNDRGWISSPFHNSGPHWWRSCTGFSTVKGEGEDRPLFLPLCRPPRNRGIRDSASGSGKRCDKRDGRPDRYIKF